MAERGRGAAITIIDLPGPGDPYYAGVILDRDTLTACIWALDRVIRQKDIDLPGMEVLAAQLGTPGVMDQVASKKRSRATLKYLMDAFERVARDIDLVPATTG